MTVAQWRFVQQQLDQLTDTSANRRLAFTLRLLYATGLRLSEVVAATLDDLVWVEYPADAGDGDAPVEGWLLRVVGKGEKLREVPVPQAIVDELTGYLESRGLAPEIATSYRNPSLAALHVDGAYPPALPVSSNQSGIVPSRARMMGSL